ncbi:uncharacterized protein PRCAT00005449001 [Priceomyces carsonii]|uniref:uncharacterized protein n=1 Tax=Priceomyces carsonii TaxID=28549 RepID=UPI002EDAF2C6|nr:unnamed protein product [Priceomyces carsonii]
MSESIEPPIDVSISVSESIETPIEASPKEKTPRFTEENDAEREERLAKQKEIDARSIYVGNVDYQSTPEQLESFFNAVGVIERITILFDKYSGLPKGYAYVEFELPESVEKAITELHGNTFRGRDIRVTNKRTNLPDFSKRGRGRGGRAFRGRGRSRGTFRGRGRGSGRGTPRGEGFNEVENTAVGVSNTGPSSATFEESITLVTETSTE